MRRLGEGVCWGWGRERTPGGPWAGTVERSQMSLLSVHPAKALSLNINEGSMSYLQPLGALRKSQSNHNTYILTYILIYILYIHTYTHAYILTYIHTYLHTDTESWHHHRTTWGWAGAFTLHSGLTLTTFLSSQWRGSIQPCYKPQVPSSPFVSLSFSWIIISSSHSQLLPPFCVCVLTGISYWCPCWLMNHVCKCYCFHHKSLDCTNKNDQTSHCPQDLGGLLIFQPDTVQSSCSESHSFTTSDEPGVGAQ